jgi:hypothetical protein
MEPVQQGARDMVTKTPPLYLLRDTLVMLDRDVADLFSAPTRGLNQQVARHPARFESFAWRLSKKETRQLKQQFSETGRAWGKSPYAPMVFTEHGVVMAGTVLSTDAAAEATRVIVRVFVQARRELAQRPPGRNRPVSFRPGELVPLGPDGQLDFSARLGGLFDQILEALTRDEIADQFQAEVVNVAQHAVDHVRERLKSVKIRNQQTLAEIRKLLAEADAVQSQSESRRARMAHVHLALQAKRLRLAAIAQRFLETGNLDELIAVLDGFDQPGA